MRSITGIASQDALKKKAPGIQNRLYVCVWLNGVRLPAFLFFYFKIYLALYVVLRRWIALLQPSLHRLKDRFLTIYSGSVVWFDVVPFPSFLRVTSTPFVQSLVSSHSAVTISWFGGRPWISGILFKLWWASFSKITGRAIYADIPQCIHRSTIRKLRCTRHHK